MSALRVLVDGTPLPDDQALAFWKRFSDWMEARRGDLAGFSRNEGFASVHPEMQDGAPVLVASRTVEQRPYGDAQKRSVKAERPEGGRRARGSAPALATADRKRGKRGEGKR